MVPKWCQKCRKNGPNGAEMVGNFRANCELWCGPLARYRRMVFQTTANLPSIYLQSTTSSRRAYLHSQTVFTPVCICVYAYVCYSGVFGLMPYRYSGVFTVLVGLHYPCPYRYSGVFWVVY